MFFQNSIGIDIQKNRISLGWIRGSLKGLHFEAFEAYIHDSESKEDVLTNIDVFLDEFTAKYKIKDFYLYLGIPEEYCLIKKIKLPFSVRDDIDSVLKYEIEKYIPIPVSKITYGYKVLDEDKAKGSINVLLQVLKKEDLRPFLGLKDFISGGITAIMLTSSAVEEYETHLHAGKKPLISGVDGSSGEQIPPETIRTVALAFQNFNKNKNRINFLPERFRKKPSRRPFITFLTLLPLCFIALMVMGGSYYIHGRVQNRQLDTRLLHLKDQVRKVEKLEARIQVLEKKGNETRRIMDTRSSTLTILKELTNLVPAHTSLKEFEFRKQIIRIKGSSKNASLLIEPFETSPFFSGVGFESKIMIKDKNQETFIIKMKYESQNEK